MNPTTPRRNSINSRKHATRHPLANLLPTATLATTLALAPSMQAQAAETAPGFSKQDTTTLKTVNVEASPGYLVDESASPKFVRPLQDTPQTIQIISSELFNEQGATTLSEALRNSAGVGTFYAGENGSTSTGDAVYMRGFDTSSSLFVDGVRDLGSISRDVFNIEQIEVVKGPAGTDTGRSAPTGAINMVSKQARLTDAVAGALSAGIDGQRRATADWNHVLGGTSAMRLNAMWQDSDVPGRDHVNNSRSGLAPSFGFGLGTDTRAYVNLLYVKQDNVPDGSVPTIGLPGWEPQPGLEALAGHPVDPKNFYGTRLDHDDVTAKMATVKLEHDVSDAVTLSNVARWGTTAQDYLLTAFMSTGANIRLPEGAAPDDLAAYTMTRGNPTLKNQKNRIFSDQLNLRADFGGGSVRHYLSAGLELTREKQVSPTVTRTGDLPPASLYEPDWNDPVDMAWGKNGTGSHGATDTGAVYVFDTVDVGERVLLTGGLRADHYRTTYRANAVCNTEGSSGGSGRGVVYCGDQPVGSVVETADLKASDTLVNWKLGAVYKFNPDVSVYANYALSQQPPGGANFQLSAAEGNANNPNLDPQKAKTVEVGTKLMLAGDWLSVDGAVFSTDVSNEINNQILDDAGNPTQTGEKRVRGVELSAVGQLAEDWTVSAGYTHMHTKVAEGAPIASDGSLNLTYIPGDSFVAWTTYRFDGGTTIGGGARHMGGLHRGTDGAAGTPVATESYTVLDAIVSRQINEHLGLRLNAYNLTGKHYVAAINKSGYRYTPGAARSVLFSADYRF